VIGIFHQSLKEAVSLGNRFVFSIAYTIEIETKSTLHPTGSQTSRINNCNLFIGLNEIANIWELK